jgi:hypothetical protein
MQEVVDEIVRALTSVELKGNLVLILAGYEREIDEMLTVNQGLRSRITKKIHFPDFNTKKVSELLISALKKKGFELSESALVELPALADQLRGQSGFSNGRDVETLAKRVLTNALRAREKGAISEETLIASFEQLISEMTPSPSIALGVRASEPPFGLPKQSPMMMPAYGSLLLPPPPSTQTSIATRSAMKKIERVVEETRVEEIEDDDEEREEETEEEEDEENGPDRGALLSSLQDLLDERGWNSKKGIEKILSLSGSEFDGAVVMEIARRLGADAETVRSMLKKWKEDQREMLLTLEEAEKELEKMKLTKKRGRVPIWRCGVCGRADKTYIACYVAPYVVRYEERDLN